MGLMDSSRKFKDYKDFSIISQKCDVPFRNEQLPRDFRLDESLFQMTSFTYDDIQAKTDRRLQVLYHQKRAYNPGFIFVCPKGKCLPFL